jgi:hypothetical protein
MVRVFALSAILAASILAATAEPSAPERETVNPASTGNLPTGFYVKSGCATPNQTAPAKPPSNERADLVLYNNAIQHYNKQLREADACARDYAQRAQHDIEWIRFTVNAAVTKANGANPTASPPAPGNMSSGFYPSPDCTQPDKQPLGAVPDGHDVKAMEAYNRNVKAYNALAEAFTACLKGYVTRANADIERIEESVRGDTVTGAIIR